MEWNLYEYSFSKIKFEYMTFGNKVQSSNPYQFCLKYTGTSEEKGDYITKPVFRIRIGFMRIRILLVEFKVF
jgi:hypothetical protein